MGRIPNKMDKKQPKIKKKIENSNKNEVQNTQTEKKKIGDMTADERREYDRETKKRYRERQKVALSLDDQQIVCENEKDPSDITSFKVPTAKMKSMSLEEKRKYYNENRKMNREKQKTFSKSYPPPNELEDAPPIDTQDDSETKRFIQMSDAEKRAYNTEKQKERREKLKKLKNSSTITHNELDEKEPPMKRSRYSTDQVHESKSIHPFIPETRKPCKIRIGLMDIFDIETEAIVIPCYENQFYITKSLHQQMRRKFKPVAPHLFEDFESRFRSSEWTDKIKGYGCMDYDWDEEEDIRAVRNVRNKIPLKTIHVRPPYVSKSFSVTTEAHLRASYLSSLLHSDQSGYQSITFPILGHGVCRRKSVAIGLQTILAYMHAVKHTNLELIYIVTRNVDHYDELGAFLSYVREIDLSRWKREQIVLYEQFIYNQITSDNWLATIPGTDMVRRVMHSSYEQGKVKTTKEELKTIHNKMGEITGINIKDFVLYQNDDKRSKVTAQTFIKNGQSENRTFRPNFMNIQFDMNHFCGSNAALRNLWIVSYYFMYFHNYFDDIDFDSGSVQEELRKKAFHQLKSLHRHVLKKWNFIMKSAPYKCNCTKIDGIHEKLSLFLTHISHYDDIIDKFILNGKSLVLNLEDDVLNKDIQIVYGKEKVTLVTNEKEFQELALSRLEQWLKHRYEYFHQQKIVLGSLFNEINVSCYSIGGEADPDEYDPEKWDKDFMAGTFEEYSSDFELLAKAVDKVEELKMHGTITEQSYALQKVKASMQSIELLLFSMHIAKDTLMEKTIRNRLFKTFESFLVPDSVDDWEKEDDISCSVDEWISKVLAANGMETIEVPKDTTIDYDQYDTPEEIRKTNALDYPKAVYLGKRNIECAFCGALSFADERVKKCCKQGTIWIPPLKKAPEAIESILKKKYRKYIICTNAAFSMASISYNRQAQAKGGIQSMKIKGTMSFHPSALHPHKGKDPRYANFIVLDHGNEEIAEMRFNSLFFVEEEHQVLKPIFIEIQEYLAEHNKCYHLFKNMADLEKEYILATGDTEVDNSKLQFRIVPIHDLEKKDREQLAHHPGVYADPKRIGAGCITVAYTWNSVDAAVIPRGLTIYPYNPKCGNQLPLSVFDDNCDKLCYPLLYPDGEGGWALHKYERYTKKGPKPTYQQRKRDHINQLLREEKDPREYYKEYAKEIDKTHPKKSSHLLDIFSAGDQQPSLTCDSESEDEVEELDPSNLNDDQILKHGKLEDEQEYPMDGSIGEKPNFRMELRNGEMYSVLDKSQKTIEIGPAGDIFGTDDEEEAPFKFEPELGDDREFDEKFEDLQTHEDRLIRQVEQDENGGDDYDDDDDAVCYGDEHNAEPTALARRNDGIRVKNIGKRKHVSIAEFATFIFQDRNEVHNQFHGRAFTLGQLYRIDLALRMKEQRAQAIIQHRAEFYRSVNRSKVFDFLQSLVNKNLGAKKKTLGMLVTMPSTVPGSAKYQRELVMSAITTANLLGRPNLFLTLTGNPKWREIEEECKKLSCEWADVPELVCSVFKTKFDIWSEVVLGKLVKKSSLNGKYVREPGLYGMIKWFSYSVEFQQRGMPHVHMVVALETPWTTISDIDRYISAEVPELPDEHDVDYEEKMRYYNLVMTYMTHFPCQGDPTAYCNEGKKPYMKRCTKGLPYNTCTETTLRDNQYPQYRRTPGRFFEIFRNGKKVLVGSEYVVAHTRELLLLLETHCNVECIDSVQLFKYIFKYIYKGPDRVLLEGFESLKNGKIAPDAMTLQGNIFAPANMNPGKVRERQNDGDRQLKANGVNLAKEQVLVINDCHYMLDLSAMTACEAVWKLQGYPMHGSSHRVHRMYVHEENNDTFIVKRGVDRTKAEEMLNEPSKGMMEAWFEQNRNPVDLPNGKKTTDLTMPEMASFFKFDMAKQQFILRKKDYSDHTFGRIQAPPPYLLELVATRILAMHVRGPRSWEELRSFEDVVYDTCLQAARARRLMNGEKEWDDLLKEIGEFAHPVEIRRFFVSILVHCAPVNPLELFENNFEVMFENKKSWTKEQKMSHALRHIQFLLGCHKLTLDHFELGEHYKEEDLPKITKDVEYDNPSFDPIEPSEHEKKGKEMYSKLNHEQKHFVDRVLKLSTLRNRSRLLFVEGPGGTGKTFCYQTIYHLLRAQGILLACVAHTGIAACLLPFGCTSHRSFSIPLAVSDRMRCSIVQGTLEADLLKLIGAIVWDEACMTDRRIYDAVNILFQTLHNNDLPFGGVLVIMGGDWRQILPIVEHIRGEGVLEYVLKNGELWQHVERFKLTLNQRAISDPDFAKFILDIGDGSNYVNEKRKVIAMPGKFVERGSEKDLINWVFPNINDIESTKHASILTVDNKNALRINNMIVQTLNTEERVFLSEDVSCKDNGLSVDPEVFATQTPQGLPEHILRIRIGAQVVLLRNLSVQHGLCNGTRLTVKSFEKDIIYCTVNNKLSNSPDMVYLHRIRMSPSGNSTGLNQFTRLQYPIRLAYACTINKSQGQTLDRCGLMLHTPVFSHGQLYVAMSRVKKAEDFRIWHFKRNNSDDYFRNGGILVRNVVFKSVLRDENVKTTLESIRPAHQNASIAEPNMSSNICYDMDIEEQTMSQSIYEMEKAGTTTNKYDEVWDDECNMNDTISVKNSSSKPVSSNISILNSETFDDSDMKDSTTEITTENELEINEETRTGPAQSKRKSEMAIGVMKKLSQKGSKAKKPKEQYLLLENLNETECFMNTIVNILYSCEGIRELFKNRVSDPAEPISNIVSMIFQERTNSAREWRATLSDTNYHTRQQDICEIFFFLMQDLSNEIRLPLMEFETIDTKECETCRKVQMHHFPISQFSNLSIPQNDTFENTFELAYKPKKCSASCGCGGDVWKTRTINQYGSYHFMVLNHVFKKFKAFKSNNIVKMFGFNWILRSFAEYQSTSSTGKSGHFRTWVRLGEQWACINDDTVMGNRRKNVDLSKMYLKILVFEKC